MVDTGQPPPDPGDKLQNPKPSPTNLPGQLSGNPAWSGTRVTGGTPMRPFALILEEEKKNRNILEIHLGRVSSTDDENSTKSKKGLTFDDLGELIF